MDSRVTELQCIMPIENIPSVMQRGILSHERAEKLPHRSVAMQEMQDRRDLKHVPGGLKLHQYANLYFHARNPMLYKRQAEFSHLCVLQVSTTVLSLPHVVITDRNAAADFPLFLPPSQWRRLDFDEILSMDWRDQDQFAYFRKKSRKCAEVLVPHVVEPRFITGARVIDQKARAKVFTLTSDLAVTIDPVLFFRS